MYRKYLPQKKKLNSNWLNAEKECGSVLRGHLWGGHKERLCSRLLPGELVNVLPRQTQAECFEFPTLPLQCTYSLLSTSLPERMDIRTLTS